MGHTFRAGPVRVGRVWLDMVFVWSLLLRLSNIVERFWYSRCRPRLSQASSPRQGAISSTRIKIILTRFKIMNTYYKKKKNRRWTWRSPNFETFNEIDYVLVDKNNIVKNFEVLNKVNVDSDHRMIRCKVQIDSKQERKRLFHSKPEPLRVCKQIVNEFKIDLQNRYAALEEQHDDSNNSISLNDMINNITEPLIGAGKKWKSSTKRNSKFSEETKNFMEKRRNLKTPTTAKEKIEATELNKLIRKKQRNDLRKHKATTIQRVIEQGKSFKMAKRQLNRGRLQFTSVLEEDGTLTTDRERIVERSR